MGRPQTKEQRLAKQIVDITNDVSLDLDDIGKTIANAHPTVSYNRFILIAESAVEEKKNVAKEREQLSDDIDERFEQYRQASM